MDANWTTGHHNNISNNVKNVSLIGSHIYLILYVVFGILGILLNTFTILILTKGKKFGQSIRIQLTNLAAADLICSIILPSTVVLGGFTTVRYPNISSLCKTQQYLTYTLFYASLLFNAALSLEKFVVVYYPLALRNYQRRHIIVVTTSVWIIALAAQLDIAIDSGVYLHPYDNQIVSCFPSKAFISTDTHYFQQVTIVYAIKYIMPSIAILLAYGLIGYKLWRRKAVGEMTFNKKTLNQQVSLHYLNLLFYLAFL